MMATKQSRSGEGQVRNEVSGDKHSTRPMVFKYCKISLKLLLIIIS